MAKQAYISILCAYCLYSTVGPVLHFNSPNLFCCNTHPREQGTPPSPSTPPPLPGRPFLHYPGGLCIFFQCSGIGDTVRYSIQHRKLCRVLFLGQLGFLLFFFFWNRKKRRYLLPLLSLLPLSLSLLVYLKKLLGSFQPFLFYFLASSQLDLQPPVRELATQGIIINTTQRHSTISLYQQAVKIYGVQQRAQVLKSGLFFPPSTGRDAPENKGGIAEAKGEGVSCQLPPPLVQLLGTDFRLACELIQ